MSRWKKCENCQKEYFSGKVDACPICNNLVDSSEGYLSAILKKEGENRQKTLMRQAEDQAVVVDKFGEFLQIIGYVLIAIFIIGLVLALFTESWIALIYFFISIPVTFVVFNVFGSAIRAVALYIQVRVK